MSGLLLDTHVVLWLLADDQRLGGSAREQTRRASAVFVSAASIWELGIKASLGKLTIPDSLGPVLDAGYLRDLPVTRAHTLAVAAVVLPHRDPFDALLVAQARCERLAFLTADEKILAAWPDAIDARR